MRRRDLLAGAAAAAALPSFAIGQQAGSRVLKFVPQANLTSLDPIWTTANVTRNHAWMVHEVLYAVDQQFRPQPQMAAGHVMEEDGRLCTITLREGLRFHDGEPVRGLDCVASLQRWMKRNSLGQKLASVLEEITAPDDRRIRLRLRRPFPRLLEALATPSNPAAFIMPERLARTDAFQQVREVVGSGPYRFLPREYNSGSFIAYERNPDYRPVEQGEPSLLAGPKHAHFDRIEWHIITDAATAAGALQTGEIDWYEQPPPEIQQLLRRNRQISVEPIDRLKNPALLRFNHLHPPFNDKRMRQALLPAINQVDFMQAIVGTDPSLYETMGIFTPGTPLVTDAGMEVLTGPRSIDRAKAMLKEAGYDNQLIRLIGPTDILAPAALTQVAGDMFRRLGVNLDFVLTDWGSVVQRRASREPLDKGGWSVFLTASASFEYADPANNYPLRGNGLNGWFGWPTMPRLEELRDAWFDAPDLEAQRRIAREIQLTALDDLPYIPVGAYTAMTSLRRNLTGRVPGFALFWNLRRT
ncbi:ABC transporter substrate-binding protein [Paracraurococcus lichenis]|uniref:ABC transporter substrate-binding protein n=1 Tax=Paracraurococcus lichenis TaxID=3064888 RepID=A0ABT9DWH4_9PROT|nr:ABC transporter substrate-binding protein [Paracraurococcus sp. LOR1-02]MDO9708248.1 ABC transporter substrate-binding protein [Paracraurococcus sp. LOR1-02]